MENLNSKIPNRKFLPGFTLIELLVVVAIVSVLMGLLLPMFGKTIDRARRSRTQATVTQVADAWKIMMQDARAMPTNYLNFTAKEGTQMTSNNCYAILKDYYDFNRITSTYGILSDWGMVKARRTSPLSNPIPRGYYVHTRLSSQGEIDLEDGVSVRQMAVAWASFKPTDADTGSPPKDITSW